jgi:Tfp pilus assembly protein PilF
MVQWLHGYSLLPDDVRMVLRTFRAVFPDTTVWQASPGDYLLLGTVVPRPLDLEAMARRWDALPEVRRELEGIGVESWAGLLSHFLVDADGTARLSRGGRLNDDDRLPLEFSAPRALYLDTSVANHQLLASARTRSLPPVTRDSERLLARPEVRFAMGMTLLRRGAPEHALRELEAALLADPDHVGALRAAAIAHLRLGHGREAATLAGALLRGAPAEPAALSLAGLAAAQAGDGQAALALLARAAASLPGSETIERVLAEARQGRLGPIEARREAHATWLLP